MVNGQMVNGNSTDSSFRSGTNIHQIRFLVPNDVTATTTTINCEKLTVAFIIPIFRGRGAAEARSGSINQILVNCYGGKMLTGRISKGNCNEEIL